MQANKRLPTTASTVTRRPVALFSGATVFWACWKKVEVDALDNRAADESMVVAVTIGTNRSVSRASQRRSDSPLLLEKSSLCGWSSDAERERPSSFPPCLSVVSGWSSTLAKFFGAVSAVKVTRDVAAVSAETVAGSDEVRTTVTVVKPARRFSLQFGKQMVYCCSLTVGSRKIVTMRMVVNSSSIAVVKSIVVVRVTVLGLSVAMVITIVSSVVCSYF
ncbi:hypothetical protein HGRIS_002382 [Hohenbuehelia grisea]|uniref:Uncharacterized protein n=1 Tax=Hohenbuehelia grisea TaxID=104357 RepID=A0ABR3JL09_9AGAR